MIYFYSFLSYLSAVSFVILVIEQNKGKGTRLASPMLGDSSVLGSSISRGDTAVVAAPPEGRGGDGSGGVGVGSNNSGEENFRGGVGEDLLGSSGERSFGGNRWPRQETIALLQIRSDMDVVFRDASVKGPLWEEVSRLISLLYIYFDNYLPFTILILFFFLFICLW